MIGYSVDPATWFVVAVDLEFPSAVFAVPVSLAVAQVNEQVDWQALLAQNYWVETLLLGMVE